MRVTVLVYFPFPQISHRNTGNIFFFRLTGSVNSVRASAKITSAVWETGAKSIPFLMELPQQLVFSSAATLLGMLREQ